MRWRRRWWLRRRKLKIDRCRGIPHDSYYAARAWAEGRIQLAYARGALLESVSPVYRCADGHFHIDVVVRHRGDAWPPR